MRDRVVLRSPAKTNLFLKVLSRRKDGYHNIETIFQKIDLCDEISARRIKKGIKITTDHPSLPTGRTNLVYKAARLLMDAEGVKGGIGIDIKKNIPVAAGLGGGSSNAACALLAVNRLFGLGLKQDKLLKYGSLLGADVPFFIKDAGFAIGRGIGDRLYSLDLDISIWNIVIYPGFEVSTRSVYEGFSFGLTPKGVNAKIPVRALRKNDIEGLSAGIYNALEGVTFSKYREIAGIKALLMAKGAYASLMSGSGPAVFGITRTKKEAMGVQGRILKQRRDNWKVFIAKTYSS